MSITLTAEQEAKLEHYVRIGQYPSKEEALAEAFRRFKNMLDAEAEQGVVNEAPQDAPEPA